MQTTIDKRGRVTIPLEFRKSLGLKPGDRIAFLLRGREVVLLFPIPGAPEFAKFVGIAPAFTSLAEIIAYHRDLRGDDFEEELGDMEQETKEENQAP